MNRNMYQMTLPELNAELDRLYARQYDLECVCLYEMEAEDYAVYTETLSNLYERILELEERQDELVGQGRRDLGDGIEWVPTPERDPEWDGSPATGQYWGLY